MSDQAIRWIQRFNHFSKAFAQLKEAVELSKQRELSKLEEQGLIQAFEYTHELAWKVLRDFLEERGVQKIYGSKDATREAFKAGLIENGEVWMKMIESRNKHDTSLRFKRDNYPQNPWRVFQVPAGGKGCAVRLTRQGQLQKRLRH